MRTCVRRREARSLYARTWQSIRAEKWLAIGIVVGALMHALGHALLAAAGGQLARLLGGAPPVDARSTSGLLTTLGRGDATLGLATLGMFAALVKLAGGILAAHAEARVAGEVGARLRLEVLDGVLSLHSLRTPRHSDHGAAHRVAALTTHVEAAERGVSHGVLSELRALVQLVPLAVLVGALAPRLASTAAAAFAAFALFAMAVRGAFKRALARAAADAGTLTEAADEAVRHADLWRTYGAEVKIRTHVRALGRAMAAKAASLRARAALLSGTSEVLGALGLVLALGLVAAGKLEGVERGAIVPFSIAFFMAYKPLREWIDARLVRARGEAACAAATATAPIGDAEVAELAEAPPSERRIEARPPHALEDLVIEGFASSHARHAPLSITIQRGHIVAIVGPTGIGKTQLLRTLLGLEPGFEGSVRYGDRELLQARVGPHERPFAWVPQEAPVLADTALANIALAAHSPSIAHRAAAEIGASDLVASSGERVLGRDRTLSGGERQLLAVARALATVLPVLLLDEPTSALDSATEEKLLAAIARLRGRRTVLLVTHRPAPLAIADRAVVLSPVREIDHSKERSGVDDELVAAE